MMENCLYRHCF